MSRRAGLAALAAAAAGALALGALPGPLGPLAARATLAALGVGAAALLWRRPAPPVPPSLRLEARVALGRDATLAVVEADGVRLLLGAGPQGVVRLAVLPPGAPRPAPAAARPEPLVAAVARTAALRRAP